MDHTEACLEILNIYRRNVIRRALNSLRQSLLIILAVAGISAIVFIIMGVCYSSWQVASLSTIPVLIGIAFVLLYIHDANRICGGSSI